MQMKKAMPLLMLILAISGCDSRSDKPATQPAKTPSSPTSQPAATPVPATAPASQPATAQVPATAPASQPAAAQVPATQPNQPPATAPAQFTTTAPSSIPTTAPAPSMPSNAASDSKPDFTTIMEIWAVVPENQISQTGKFTAFQTAKVNDIFARSVIGKRARLPLKVDRSDITPDGLSKGFPRLLAAKANTFTPMHFWCVFDTADRRTSGFIMTARPGDAMTVEGNIVRCDIKGDLLNLTLGQCQVISPQPLP
jgi:hypothetical protein